MKFEISINANLNQETLEYIFDCWVAFVTNDLGLMPSELPMELVGA